MKLSNLINGFLLDCKARSLAAGSIERAYNPVLIELCRFLNDPEIADITTDDLRRFVVYLDESRPLAQWTLFRYIRVTKRLFNWAEQEQILAKNPAAKVKNVRLPKGRVETFAKDEISLLLTEAKAMSYRDYTIVFLLLDSGIRRGELIALTLDDVNVINGIITIRNGKGGNQRQVRVGDKCRKILWRYVSDFRKESDSDVLFLST